MEASITAAVESTVLEATGALGTLTGWWFIPVVVSLFGVSLIISLVAGFFGRGRRKRKRK